jgi:hypothetical protein
VCCAGRNVGPGATKGAFVRCCMAFVAVSDIVVRRQRNCLKGPSPQ